MITPQRNRMLPKDKRGTMGENLKISFLMKVKTVNLKKLISIRTDIHVSLNAFVLKGSLEQ